MANRFERMDPDNQNIKKEEKKVGILKCIGGVLLAAGGIVVAVLKALTNNSRKT